MSIHVTLTHIETRTAVPYWNEILGTRRNI